MPSNNHLEKIIELKHERNEKMCKARDLLDSAEVEKRPLSRREKAQHDGLIADIERLDVKITKAGGDFDPRRTQGDYSRGNHSEESALLLAPEQRMADWYSSNGRDAAYTSEVDPDNLSIGKLVRGMVTSRWDGAEDEHRALVEGTNSAGGFLTPEPLAARFIDRVRNATRVVQLGAQTVPMTSDTLNIARMTGGASVAWKSEGAAIAASDMVFDRVTFTAQTLPILVKMSRELFEDMTPEAAVGIELEMAQALGLELDRVALRGSGTPPEPKGIKNQTGVTLQSLGAAGATPTWDNVIDGVANVRALNLEPNGILWSTRTATQLAKVKLTTGEYYPPVPALAGIQQLVTNQIGNAYTVGSSTDCSEIYIGDFSQLLIGIRTDLRFQVKVLEERFADNLQIGLLCYLRADIQLQHPEAFNVVTGVRP